MFNFRVLVLGFLSISFKTASSIPTVLNVTGVSDWAVGLLGQRTVGSVSSSGYSFRHWTLEKNKESNARNPVIPGNFGKSISVKR